MMIRRCIVLTSLVVFSWGCLESNPQPTPGQKDTNQEQDTFVPHSDTVVTPDNVSWDDISEPDLFMPDLWADLSVMDENEADQFDPMDQSEVDILPTDPCEGQTCSGAGTCVVWGDLPHCQCQPGWMNSGALECVPLPEAQWCSTGGWCFEHPRIPTQHLQGLLTAAPGEVWAFGSLATVLRGDGVTGTIEQLTGMNQIRDGAAFANGKAVAVGAAGTVAFFDGESWSVSVIPQVDDLTAVAGFGVGQSLGLLRGLGARRRPVFCDSHHQIPAP